MKTRSTAAVALAVAAALSAHSSAHAESGATLDRMPAELETRLALSAMPPHIRDKASVYLLDPAKGYDLAREGESGVACLVQRTVWEMKDDRDDIYIPLCYDAEGVKTYLKVIMDAAALRAEGSGPQALYETISQRFADGTYAPPAPGGMSYMLAPLQRTIGPPDMDVVTLSLPHYMPYAPGVTNEDIGAAPDLHDPSSLYHPFVDRQGIDAQSYLIHFVGHEERSQIIESEKQLLDDLCAYRDVLCDPKTID